MRSHLLHIAKHEQGQLVEVEAGADHIHLLAAEFIMMIMMKMMVMLIMMMVMITIKMVIMMIMMMTMIHYVLSS